MFYWEIVECMILIKKIYVDAMIHLFVSQIDNFGSLSEICDQIKDICKLENGKMFILGWIFKST